MKNLLNFFFSFDKLFKEKLVVPFFWLALVVIGLAFSAEILDSIKLGILADIVYFVNFFALLLLSLVTTRIIAELMVAIFRINDNLSPDKGRSELADINPVAEARKAAEIAAARTREATKIVSEKTSDATKSLRENVGEMSESVQNKAKSASASVREKTDGLSTSAKEKTESLMGKASVTTTADQPTPIKTVEPTAAPKKRGRPAGSTNKTKTASKPKTTQTAAPKKRGRPAGSKNKTTTKASSAKTATAPKKRGPKPGSKAPRDADGNLLKKDGTPRKKPGPKPK